MFNYISLYRFHHIDSNGVYIDHISVDELCRREAEHVKSGGIVRKSDIEQVRAGRAANLRVDYYRNMYQDGDIRMRTFLVIP